MANPAYPRWRDWRKCVGGNGENYIDANSEKLAAMPTDADIDFLFSVYSASPSREDGGPEWGDRAVWEDLHHRDPYPFWLD